MVGQDPHPSALTRFFSLPSMSSGVRSDDDDVIFLGYGNPAVPDDDDVVFMGFGRPAVIDNDVVFVRFGSTSPEATSSVNVSSFPVELLPIYICSRSNRCPSQIPQA